MSASQPRAKLARSSWERSETSGRTLPVGASGLARSTAERRGRVRVGEVSSEDDERARERRGERGGAHLVGCAP